MNIVDEIFASCDRSAIALINGERELSFGALENLTRDASAAFTEFPQCGIPRVGLACPNGFAHIVLSLAILSRGGCLVPVPDELSPRERQALADITSLDALVVADGGRWDGESAKVSDLDIPDLAAQWHDGVTEQSPAFPVEAFESLAPALIRFSSGTTGKSKGVVLSHRTLLDRVTACNRALEIGPGDRVIWILPMAHHFAVSIVLYLLHGATTVLENSHLGEDVYRALWDKRGTVLYAAPFHYAMLCAHKKIEPVDSLRLAVSTAAPLPTALAARFAQRFQLPLTQGLGIIEVGLPLLNRACAATKPGSVGRPGPDFEARLASGPPELQIRGPGIFDAYLSPWQARDEVLLEGVWFATGDLAVCDGIGGDYTLIGRKKTLINVGGMKVFPEEVEAVLCEHPEVGEARVLARDHASLGQIPVAEIVPADFASPPSKPSLLSFCRARLSGYKVPMTLAFVGASRRRRAVRSSAPSRC